MSPGTDPGWNLLTVAAALALYALLVHAAWGQTKDRINPDAICYVRNALYLTQGRFRDALSGYWSPLLSWCVAPLLALGFDGLHSALAVLVGWGGVFIVSSYALLRRLASFPRIWALVALLLVAEATVKWVTTIFPDVILAACLMAFCATITAPAYLERRSLQIASGACGGLAYLSKAYGLPFFVVFLPASLVLLHGWHRLAAGRSGRKSVDRPDGEPAGRSGRESVDRPDGEPAGRSGRESVDLQDGSPADSADGERGAPSTTSPRPTSSPRSAPSDERASGRRNVHLRRLLSAWAVAMAAFAALTLPWISGLSLKLGRPTFGLVGGINHAIIGPQDFARDELWTPSPDRVTVWEVPEERPYRFWSPLDSRAAFLYQLKYSWGTARKIRDSIARFDYLSLSIGLLLVSPFVFAALGESRAFAQALWVCAAVAIFSAGFVFVYYDYRYVTPFLKPLCLIACLHFALVLGDRIRAGPWTQGPGRSRADAGDLPGPGSAAADPRRSLPDLGEALVGWGRSLLPSALAGIVAVSFATHMNVPFVPYLVEEPGGTPFNNVTVDSAIHRAAGRRLREAGCDGPIASTCYWGGMYVAYFMDTPFVGTPASPTFESCRAELDRVAVRTFLVDPAWRFAISLRSDPAWKRLLALDVGEGGPIDVYVRVPG